MLRTDPHSASLPLPDGGHLELQFRLAHDEVEPRGLVGQDP